MMMRLRMASALFSVTIITTSSCVGADAPIAVSSPDGKIRAEILLDKAGDDAAVPHVRIFFNDQPVLLPSPVQMHLADGTALGPDSEIEKTSESTIDERYRQHPGKRSEVVNHCNETVVSLHSGKASPKRWEIVTRASNDGVAFRYRFPAQEGWPKLELATEETTFALPENAESFALPLNGFTTSHENRYLHQPLAELPKDQLFGLPLLLQIPNCGWAAIAEANLTDYAGLYVVRENETSTRLVSRLSPLPGEPGVVVRAPLPHDSPWRVVMIADEPGRLVESDLLLNLNEPSVIKDVSWIETGKTTFPWWNGFYEENVPFKPGLNTTTTKYYIDFCAEAGIPYHSLDGVDNIAWYGGTIVPYEGADITKAIETIDLPEVLRYAKEKGVKLRIWMHWQAAKKHMARAFPIYHEWGIEGVMIDFMDRDDQEMVKFQRELLQLAADNHLTVNLHGASAPTGLERTFPNLLNTEAVMNLEYDKWDKQGIPPEHELTVVFTRMLAGPMDFHQGSFRAVPIDQFKPQNEAPLVIGTPCRTLASYVVYQNHLPMAADYPSAYRGHPALETLVAIPTTWDETHVLDAAVGQSVVIARRHGDDWWIGAMTDRQPRTLSIPLTFLGEGRFRADWWQDDAAATPPMARKTQEATSSDELNVKLAPCGGTLIHVVPIR